MKLISSTLKHKVIPSRVAPEGRAPLVMLMHGRGANEDDLLGLSEYFDERIFFVSARAPFDFGFGGGYTWYDVLEVGTPEPKMFAESYKKIVQFHSDVIAGYPIDPTKVFMLGFSMGTMMSYAFALSNPSKVRGVLANSGYIPEGTELVYDWKNVKNVGFHVCHGTQDPVVPVEFGRRAKELLTPNAPELEYHEYPMGHQIAEEQLSSMAKWIGARI